MTQRSAFVLHVRPDKIDHYVEAHRQVWPEMLRALTDAGIRHLDKEVISFEKMFAGITRVLTVTTA